MSLVVRPADERDASTLANIYLLAREDALPDLPRSFNDREIHAWMRDEVLAKEDVRLATERGVVKGFAAVHDRTLTHLWVSPPFQRKGVGRTLLDKLRQVHDIKLDAVIYADSASAKAFLEKEGFKLLGAKPPAFDGGKRLLYRWRRKK